MSDKQVLSRVLGFMRYRTTYSTDTAGGDGLNDWLSLCVDGVWGTWPALRTAGRIRVTASLHERPGCIPIWLQRSHGDMFWTADPEEAGDPLGALYSCTGTYLRKCLPGKFRAGHIVKLWASAARVAA